MQHRLKFTQLGGTFAVTRLDADASVPEWATMSRAFCSVTRTRDELSIVCAEQLVPASVKTERGWRCLKLEGPFPFAQTGVLVSFLSPLSQRAIPIFALSTFDTDYVLIKEANEPSALQALAEAGHELTR